MKRPSTCPTSHPAKWALVMLAVLLLCVLPYGLQREKDQRPDQMSPPSEKISTMDLSSFADTPPQHPLRLLFIHHSCGGQLLAAVGPEVGTNCIYRSHPNGGGLRTDLERYSYEVHEASYGSSIGDHTDIFDWLPKFRNQMEPILDCDSQDAGYADSRSNQIVVFKSCFPNNAFRAEGTAPGNPAGPDLTVWNAKAAFMGLLEEFRKRPDVLFVCVTTPPLAPDGSPWWKRAAKWALGQCGLRHADDPVTSAALARQFNSWLAGREGWLANYSLSNVVVFDYYDILTGKGQSNFSAYPTRGGYDSHPSQEGNSKAADTFVPFLNRAVRRAGLSP